jgi:CheY-specific phosphatase CheX
MSGSAESCDCAVTDLLPSDRLARSVSRVTATMLGLTFRAVVPATKVELWRTAVLTIPGTRPITVALSSDRRGCAALTSAMLGMDEDGLGVEMIDDFMRELVNMTAGQIKIELALDQALGLPRMIDGDELFASPKGWAHHVLDSDSINLVVSLLPELV